MFLQINIKEILIAELSIKLSNNNFNNRGNKNNNNNNNNK